MLTIALAMLVAVALGFGIWGFVRGGNAQDTANAARSLGSQRAFGQLIQTDGAIGSDLWQANPNQPVHFNLAILMGNIGSVNQTGDVAGLLIRENGTYKLWWDLTASNPSCNSPPNCPVMFCACLGTVSDLVGVRLTRSLRLVTSYFDPDVTHSLDAPHLSGDSVESLLAGDVITLQNKFQTSVLIGESGVSQNALVVASLSVQWIAPNSLLDDAEIQ